MIEQSFNKPEGNYSINSVISRIDLVTLKQQRELFGKTRPKRESFEKFHQMRLIIELTL